MRFEVASKGIRRPEGVLCLGKRYGEEGMSLGQDSGWLFCPFRIDLLIRDPRVGFRSYI